VHIDGFQRPMCCERALADSKFAAIAKFVIAHIHKSCLQCRGSLNNVKSARAITFAEFAVEAIADVRVFSFVLLVVSLLSSSLVLILKPGAALLHVT